MVSPKDLLTNPVVDLVGLVAIGRYIERGTVIVFSILNGKNKAENSLVETLQQHIKVLGEDNDDLRKTNEKLKLEAKKKEGQVETLTDILSQRDNFHTEETQHIFEEQPTDKTHENI